MNIISFCLFVLSGVSVSRILLHEEKKQTDKLCIALDFAKYLNEQIELFKQPLTDIIKGYSKAHILEKEYNCMLSENPFCIFDMLCNDGGKASELFCRIIDGSFEQALSGSVALVKHLEHIEAAATKSCESKKRILTVFPIAIGILLGLLVI